MDYTVKFWDFNGMNQRHKPFRSVEPFESYPVYHCEFSFTGDTFVATTGLMKDIISFFWGVICYFYHHYFFVFFKNYNSCVQIIIAILLSFIIWGIFFFFKL